jgi:hypothetical protein
MLIQNIYNLATVAYCRAQSVSEQFTAGEWGKGADSRTDMVNILNKVQDIMLAVAGALAVLAIIYGAFQYATAGGDETKIATAKKTITYTLIGVVLIMIFYLVLSFIIKGNASIGTLIPAS